ncbi:MAG: PH domain-containing protein [Candidatus Niyogibacteria bacterium]|nr:PH domain-containing protein [Candidatus Niyogibacteria bacterium]
MFHLKPEEKIILSIHRHWLVIAGKMTVIAVMLLIAVIILTAAINYLPEYIVLAMFILTVYVLIILLVAFIFWVNFYLDMWIVTSERIIDIEQKKLFQRKISEFMLSRVQDVTVEIPNFLATVFKFGNITVQTAGAQSFIIKDIPYPEQVKNIILEYVKKNQILNQYERTL